MVRLLKQNKEGPVVAGNWVLFKHSGKWRICPFIFPAASFSAQRKFTGTTDAKPCRALITLPDSKAN